MKEIKDKAKSLELARLLTEMVNADFATGEIYDKVTPLTKELLTWWFSEGCKEQRMFNFHAGQQQAILNIIYLHEVLGVRSVEDIYANVDVTLIDSALIEEFAKKKYQMPKYAVKMATGTGKTWVMHALLLWQMLNARKEEERSGRFTQNFLIVAPGIIVYDRLLDAFCGRMKRGTDVRDIQTNDFYRNQDLFIPPHLRDEVFSFIQNNVVTKEDGIGKKTTGDGMIALTNWHLFENQMDDEALQEEESMAVPDIIKDLLPIRPGKTAGNELGSLDRRFLSGMELDYLANRTDLMVINDEAHHIHEVKRGGEIQEVEWQRGLNYISKDMGDRYFQIDFSATPYDTRGSGEKQQKLYFPHIVVDFDLKTAMYNGLVKTLLLDKRQELTELGTLDFRAERDADDRVVGLSSGQRLMLRAGLQKLQRLEKDFLEIDKSKHPKMLVMCEDTSVSPYVVEFMKEEGLTDEEVVSIDSSKKGEVNEKEWKEIKTKLFDIDKYASPKVIVSVLMLREGFDVNNICVIVPLRSSEASILLEQTIGRGLRLMWREEDYKDIKFYDRRKVLVNHQAPDTYLDMLSIIEHPAFERFYDDLMKDGLVISDTGEIGGGGSTGDLINVGLKEDYDQYDIEWPIILCDVEEELEDREIDIMNIPSFNMYPLAKLRQFLTTDGETFVSHEVTTKTQFGKYKVTADLFTASSYNEYLQKILRIITNRLDRLPAHKGQTVPNIQINLPQVVGALDMYIRTRLFAEPFNPFSGNDWKILLAKEGVVTQFIIREMAIALYKMFQNVVSDEPIVHHEQFSLVKTLKMRENFSLELRKTIYERTGYPSNKGGFEKQFLEFLDRDAEVERFVKVNEYKHTFATVFYVRIDGMMATYHPDFVVVTAEKVYIVETKGNDRKTDMNVRRKQTAMLEWLKKVNALAPELRMGRTWEYILLFEDNFYSLSSTGATITDICERTKISFSVATGDLFAEETFIL